MNPATTHPTPLSPDRPARVLVSEDEPDLREAIVAYLSLDAVAISGVGSLAQAQSWCEANDFDVLILDLGLPDGDALAWLQESGVLGDRGVLILTARGAPAQRLEGLRAGADAYLVKPVPLEELALHVKRLFARVGAPSANRAERQPNAALAARQPAWQLNTQTWMLTAPNGQGLLLKHAERLLLQALMQPAGEVLTKERLVESLGADPENFDYRRIETLIRRLRVRCRDSLGTELPIQTVYGRGLAFTESASITHGLATPHKARVR
jgi:DNA-binding response OmpR family regulator